MSDNTYNGYTNYETWCVSLWMHNDAGDADWMAEQAREAIAEARENPNPIYVYEGCDPVPVTQARILLTETLRDTFTENMPEIDGFYGDLLESALERVDWREIADGEIRAALDEEAIQ